MKKLSYILALALGGLVSIGPAWAVTEVASDTHYAASGSLEHDDLPEYILYYRDFSQWPITASAPALSALNKSAFAWASGSGTASMGNSNFARFEWESASFMGNVVSGGRMATGLPFRRYCNQSSGNIEVKIRARVNETDRLANARIYLEDSSGTVSNTSVYGTLADNSWVVLTATFDLSASPFSSTATEHLRVYVEAEGTTTSANVGLTQFDIEYIALRQYDD